MCFGPDRFFLGCKHSISRVREALLGAVVLLLLLWALLGAVVQQLELLVLVSGSSEVVEDTITLLSWISSSPQF